MSIILIKWSKDSLEI